MPGTVSKSFTTSRGNIYNCQILDLSVTESRARATQNRAFQADLNRLNARNEVARKAMDRIDNLEVNEDTDIDALYAEIDVAASRVQASEDAVAQLLDSYDLLGLFVQSVDGYASLTDLPTADYQELIDMARDFVDGVVSGEVPSTEQ